MAVFESYLGKAEENDIVDTFYVADYLLEPDPASQIRNYDLSGFNTPITDLEIAKQLDGLTPQSILISRSYERNARLNEFYDRYVEAQYLVHQSRGGEAKEYGESEVSLIGFNGSMIHVRRPSAVDEQADFPVPMLAVISHIDDPQPATQVTATRQDVTRHDGTTLSMYTVGVTESPSLQRVNRPMNEVEWDIEKILLRNLAAAALPIIEVTSNGMRYSRSDGHWEMCGDLGLFRKRVGLSLSRGLGYASMPSETVMREEPSGQFDQKVLV